MTQVIFAVRLIMYEAFIDGLVKMKDGVISKWILGKGYPELHCALLKIPVSVSLTRAY